MSIIGSNVLAGASGGAGAADYQIDRSLRFNSSDSAYLSRTPASAGNRKTWTWAGWVKRSKLAVQQSIFGANVTGGQGFRFRFESSDTLRVLSGNNGTDLIAVTSSVFRDPSAWFHIILQIDTTQVTGSNRAKIYVNGVQQTISFTNTPSQNQDLSVNSAIEHQISNADGFGYVDLYLADVHFIDGQALDPTSFGEFDTNGIWQPKAYSGTYGTNGFHLDFSDNSTAAALGTDTSGNGNDWTVNNISVSGTFDFSSSEAPRSGTEPEKMFDGSTSTYWQVTSASTLTFNPPIPVTGTIKIYASRGGNNPVASDLQINGHGITTFPTSSFSAQEFTLNSTDTSAIGSSISTIYQRYEVTVSATRPYYLKINDQIVYAISPSANDSLVDVPTNGTETDTGAGGEVRGNYATLNPLNKGSTVTLSNGNLDFASGAVYNSAFSTIGVTSGKWYMEATAGTFANDFIAGISNDVVGSTYVGGTSGSYGYEAVLGAKFNNTSYTTTGYSTYTTGDIISVAFDADNGKVFFAKNGVWQESGNPATGANPAYSGLTAGPYFFGCSAGNGGTFTGANFGQRPFAYTAPSGFKALNTANLDAPVVTKPSEYMDVALYTGNGSTQSISVANHSPDLVWVKSRNDTTGHRLFDTVRGDYKLLESNSTTAEATNTNQIAITSSGFDTGNSINTNDNNDTYVAWTWDAGANSSKTYAVTVVSDGGNKYRFDGYGTSAVTLDLEEGSTYTFDQSDSSNAGHPLRFSTTSDGTHGGGSEYTTGVTTVGTPGSAGASTTIVVASGAPTLYYYCSVHSGMGGQANTNSTAGASNFDGSITSTVRANASAGFSIVTWTPQSTAGTVGHGLGAAPAMIITKDRDFAYGWFTYHVALGATNYLMLNSTNATAVNATVFSTAPTSTVFDQGTGFTSTNSYGSQVCYCFAPVDGYSSFGSYTGNGSTDGPFVYTGFRPRWIMVKCSSATDSWVILDTARDDYNLSLKQLIPNLSNAEDSTNNYFRCDILSNGFKLRTSSSPSNASAATYIYAAFAEHPFKTARAR